MSKGGESIGEGLGSCNSWEKKYRYRKAERVCPECGKSAIIKGKQEYGGGYVCFGKKGGCGAKFKDGDPSIEGQEVGQVKNPDPSEQVNTIDKMAQKRAFVAAVLISTNASDYFTQDMEDFQPEEHDYVDVKATAVDQIKQEAADVTPTVYYTMAKQKNIETKDAKLILEKHGGDFAAAYQELKGI